MPQKLATPESVFQRLAEHAGVNQLLELFPKGSLRIIGGAVRDGLLNKPLKDVDFATTLLPDAVLKLCQRHDIKAIPTGIEHGTVTIVVEGKNFEVTTLRHDSYCDGRHAEVSFTDNWAEDAQRRDFTINALALDQAGLLHDYTNGLNDLANGQVRFIGDANKRVVEDYLRILRFFRFHGRFAVGAPDAESLAACKNHADSLVKLSGERLRQELVGIMELPDPSSVVALMHEVGVWNYLLPEIPSAMTKEVFLPLIHAEQFHAQNHFTGHPRSTLRLAFCLFFTVLDQAKQSLTKLRFSNAEAAEIVRLLGLIVAPGTSESLVKASFRQLRSAQRQDGIILSHAVALLKDTAEVDEYFTTLTPLIHWQAPSFPLSGDDLIAAGYTPGSALGAALKKAEQYWEAQEYLPGKTELLAWLK